MLIESRKAIDNTQFRSIGELTDSCRFVLARQIDRPNNKRAGNRYIRRRVIVCRNSEEMVGGLSNTEDSVDVGNVSDEGGSQGCNNMIDDVDFRSADDAD